MTFYKIFINAILLIALNKNAQIFCAAAKDDVSYLLSKQQHSAKQSEDMPEQSYASSCKSYYLQRFPSQSVLSEPLEHITPTPEDQITSRFEKLQEKHRHSPVYNLTETMKPISDLDKIELLWAQTLWPYDTKAKAQQFGSTERYIESEIFKPLKIEYTNNIVKIKFMKTKSKEDQSAQPLYLKGHKNNIIDYAYHPTKKHIFATADAQTIIIWNITQEKPLTTLNLEKYPSSEIKHIYFNKDGSMIIAELKNETLVYWASPFGALTFDQLILLALIIKEFEENGTVDFKVLAQKHDKKIDILQQIFKALHQEAQDTLIKAYKIKNALTSSVCVIS